MKTIVTIALNVVKAYARDRIFHVTLLVAVFLVGMAFLLSTLATLQPYKLLLDFGFSAISLSGIAVSIFLGITAVAKEIQDKSIYTVLVKPINRHEYLIGKYLGCGLVIFLVHTIISLTLTVLLLMIGLGVPDGLIACYYLMCLESLIILAIAMFSSAFSSTILASSFTIALFLIGRSSFFLQSMANRSNDSFSKNFFSILYNIMPNLDRFNIRDVVAYAKDYPENHILISSGYFAVTVVFFISLSALLFYKRDLP